MILFYYFKSVLFQQSLSLSIFRKLLRGSKAMTFDLFLVALQILWNHLDKIKAKPKL
jgi:hypothetical protein